MNFDDYRLIDRVVSMGLGFQSSKQPRKRFSHFFHVSTFDNSGTLHANYGINDT